MGLGSTMDQTRDAGRGDRRADLAVGVGVGVKVGVGHQLATCHPLFLALVRALAQNATMQGCRCSSSGPFFQQEQEQEQEQVQEQYALWD